MKNFEITNISLRFVDELTLAVFDMNCENEDIIFTAFVVKALLDDYLYLLTHAFYTVECNEKTLKKLDLDSEAQNFEKDYEIFIVALDKRLNIEHNCAKTRKEINDREEQRRQAALRSDCRMKSFYFPDQIRTRLRED